MILKWRHNIDIIVGIGTGSFTTQHSLCSKNYLNDASLDHY